MNRTIKVYSTSQLLAQAAANQITQLLKSALGTRDRASLVLTGGSTPRRTYQVLAEQHQNSLDWQRIDVFFGDDRFVPHDHPESNYGMAAETLLEGIQPGAVYAIPTDEASPAAAAEAYEASIRSHFKNTRILFDVMLLGLGADAHIASLFPGSDDLEETERLVVASKAPEGSPVRDRITLTVPALNASRSVIFLVEGSKKQQAIRKTLHDGNTPAARIRPSGKIAWLVDEAAYPDHGESAR